MLPPSSHPVQPDISAQKTPNSSVSDLSGFDTEPMFRLIDSILPFEACLYYQFLPLGLEGKYLRLGMVSPQDSSALDYARYILAYLNCSLKTEQISSEAHQSLLTAYLNHTRTASSPRKQKQKPKKQHQGSRNEQPTLILDDSLDQADQEVRPESSPIVQETSSQLPSEPPPLPSSLGVVTPPANPDASPSTAMIPVTRLPSIETLLPLEVQACYPTAPMQFLATLAPPQMLQELLGRVLIKGIGRLYFERQSNQGRILWSQDGVLQSVLDGVPLPAFQGVISELKRLVNLPLFPILQPKQVEIERRYQQEALLLRLRVKPGHYGEEATLQVLRGVALKFYQRQQVEKLSQDALKLAQQLHCTLDEIRDRATRYALPL
ncbi:MAG TPA: hypothetical protein V6C95_06365, partial [Coleofasciculaceae cyanobacterium]